MATEFYWEGKLENIREPLPFSRKTGNLDNSVEHSVP